MLYHSADIFEGAQYLYSTPDYNGDPNVYRWNYFYTPVRIGEQTVGVRIAVRDMAKQQESQIYNWGIKKDAALDGDGDGVNRKPTDVSSTVSSEASIPQSAADVNPEAGDGMENSVGAAARGFTGGRERNPKKKARKACLLFW